MVFKIEQRLGRNWRALNGGWSRMALAVAGAPFKGGALQQDEEQKEAKAA